MSLFTSVEWLRAENNVGYGPRPIPQPRDAEISGLLRSWRSLDGPVRNAALVDVLEHYHPTLLAYSERMASLAVRDRNREHIAFGLLTLGLDAGRFDFRENLLLMPLHYDAVGRIGLLPGDLFEEAARMLPNTPAQELRAFLRRSAKDQAIESMGYIAAADADGFRYRRTW